MIIYMYFNQYPLIYIFNPFNFFIDLKQSLAVDVGVRLHIILFLQLVLSENSEDIRVDHL